MWWRPEPPRSLGQQGEDAAVRHLKRAGYKILERNRFLGRYEIDIIAREGDTVAFVEVKTRRSADPVDPQENVHREKRRRIRAAARRYIQREDRDDVYYRFDIVTVVLPEKGRPEIELIRDAFRDA